MPINRVQTFVITLIIALILQGCAASGVVKNKPLVDTPQLDGRVAETFSRILSDADQGLMLAFSGGGTRAAALAYGVLQELRDTEVGQTKAQRRLLDDVGVISSVSGGSFTAAYYGLFGDAIFTNFEDAFLRKNVEAALVNNIINPLNWFSKVDRTEYAIRYYQKEIFGKAKFSDLHQPGKPLVLINATDLSHGVRFSFMQEYFNLLCSDLSDFSVSRAVAASSAVPVLFDPVVVQNYDQCGNELPRWLRRANRRAAGDPDLQLTTAGLASYFDRKNHKYAHFVDGGITDNLGLRAIFDMTQLTGDGRAFLQAMRVEPATRLVVISVDASTQPAYNMGQRENAPDVFTTISAMTDIQLHRYNTATVSEMQRSLDAWAERISTEQTPVDVFFIRLNFDELQDEELRNYINQIPTSFNLTDAQVDTLIAAGRVMLRRNPEFQRLLAAINGEVQLGQ